MVKSSIKTLPPELKKAIDDALAADRLTLDQIVELIMEMGAKVSRSAVGRYKQDFDKVASRMRESRAMADALVAELGPASAEGQTGRLLAEMLQGIVFDHLLARANPGEDDDETDETLDMARLAKCLKDIAAATKIGVDQERAIADLVARRAAAAAKDGAIAAGLTEATALKIYDQVLGVRRSAS